MFGSIFSTKWMTKLKALLALADLFENRAYYEYSGAVKSGSRIVPQNLIKGNNNGDVFNLAGFAGDGSIVCNLDGFYFFKAKMQTVGGGFFY